MHRSYLSDPTAYRTRHTTHGVWPTQCRLPYTHMPQIGVRAGRLGTEHNLRGGVHDLFKGGRTSAPASPSFKFLKVSRFLKPATGRPSGGSSGNSFRQSSIENQESCTPALISMTLENKVGFCDLDFQQRTFRKKFPRICPVAGSRVLVQPLRKNNGGKTDKFPGTSEKDQGQSKNFPDIS